MHTQVYLNCRSLHRHHEDVLVDQNIKAASIVCLSETRYIKRDTLQSTALPGYRQYRQDAKQITKQNRPFHGLAVHSSTNFLKTLNVSSTSIGAVLFQVQNLPDVLFCSHVQTTINLDKDLCIFLISIHGKYLQNQTTVLLGDFNADLSTSSTEKNRLENLLLGDFSYKQLIAKSTTDYTSTLDLIFISSTGTRNM